MYDLLMCNNSETASHNNNNANFINGLEVFIVLCENSFAILNQNLEILHCYNPCKPESDSSIKSFKVLSTNKIAFSCFNNINIYDFITGEESSYNIKTYKKIERFVEIIDPDFIFPNDREAKKKTTLFHSSLNKEYLIMACLNNKNKYDFIIYSLINKSKYFLWPEFSENWDGNVFRLFGNKLFFSEKDILN